MKTVVFYSWQSDSPAHIGREFIEQATQAALSRILSTKNFNIEPVLDRDIQGLSGSPAIADSIFRKIDESAIFIADVTIINSSKAKRPTPNPNVLLELGYAVSKLGWERVICVMNQEFGKPDKLPFDIKHRRWPILYRLSVDTKIKQAEIEKKHLSDNIELALRNVFESGILINSINPKDKRVALELSRALMEFRSVLMSYLSAQGLEGGTSVFDINYEDDPDTNYPDATVLMPIVNVLLEANVLSDSNIRIGDQTLSWANAFSYSLRNTVVRCNTILNRYADRDERLVDLVDIIGERASILAFMIETGLTQPELLGLYDHGIPQVQIDWYRVFLQYMLKAYRVIREFGV